MKHSKEEIKAKIQKWQDRLDNFKEELVFGKWVVDDRYPRWIMFYDEDGSRYGLDGDGDWYSDKDGHNINCGTNRLATDQEVEDALIAEAKKRGLKKGVKYKSVNSGFTYSCNEDWNMFNNCLSCSGSGGWVFDNGKWAEIIPSTPEYTMEELTDKLGHTFKIKK